ncbi:MAG: bifunctional sulfate adenylyltransferase/adenylylsulfate kinase [Bryobacteraceae bacterium]
MPESSVQLVSPYGGRLVNLLVAGEERDELARRAGELRSVQLSARSVCDFELLAVGAFSPVDRFLGAADYSRVLDEMRLANGLLFPVPVTLPVDSLEAIKEGTELALRNSTNNLLAWMRVEEIFERDPARETAALCGSGGEEHPLAAEMKAWGHYCLSGPLRAIALPAHVDFPELRRTPAQTRRLLASMNNPNVLAFQPGGPMHRAEEEATRRAAARAGATLLIHPVAGITKPGDMDHYTRVRIYKALVEGYYPKDRCLLGLLPLATRMAGPREALWHAIIRRNYGASHFLVGRGHAGAGTNSAWELISRHAQEIGVRAELCEELVYVEDEDRYEEVRRLPQGARTRHISPEEVREKYLAQSLPLPAWFTRPETAEILAAAHPPRWRQGFCLWFTGLPSAGKSTIAEIASVLLLEHGRQATVLDGDVVRTHLSKGLGFSREDRDTNILRIGFVASEVVRHGGAAIGAAVSPYRATRNRVRSMMPQGSFIEIFVDTPVSVCEERDVKGFYARARAGLIKGFTGVDDPYEPPLAPEIVLQTATTKPAENAARVIAYLTENGFLRPPGKASAPNG